VNNLWLDFLFVSQLLMICTEFQDPKIYDILNGIIGAEIIYQPKKLLTTTIHYEQHVNKILMLSFDEQNSLCLLEPTLIICVHLGSNLGGITFSFCLLLIYIKTGK
jgi:hypothetical protein